jgi:hypothetical protein
MDGPNPLMSKVMGLVPTIGDGSGRSRTSYNPTICGQSVAVGWGCDFGTLPSSIK